MGSIVGGIHSLQPNNGTVKCVMDYLYWNNHDARLFAICQEDICADDISTMKEIIDKKTAATIGIISDYSSIMDQGNVLKYSEIYEQYKSSNYTLVTGLDIDNKLCSKVDMARAIGELVELFKKIKSNPSESIIKNFIVKILYLSDKYLGKKYINKSSTLATKTITKIAILNVQKLNDLMFTYFVYRLGIDVLICNSNMGLDKTAAEAAEKWLKSELITIEKGNIICSKSMISRDSLKKNRPSNQMGSYNTGIEDADSIPEIYVEQPVSREAPRANKSSESNGLSELRELRELRELNMEEIAKLASSVVMIAIHDDDGEIVASGSGIMIGSDGYILTNDHVIRGGSFYSVKIENDDNLYTTSTIVKYNNVMDLAIIKIDKWITPLRIFNPNSPYSKSKGLVRGQKIAAIGSPMGLFNSVSDGIISGFRKQDNWTIIQHTAPSSPGSSGGALLNLYGEVIGVTCSGVKDAENLNFAIGYEFINTFCKGFMD